MNTSTMSVGQCATLACLLEAIAPKPGNVHRAADFEDLSFTDFAVSASAIGPVMEAAVENGVGRTVLEAVRVTRQFVSTNTNLGIVLLLSPLAAVPRSESLQTGVPKVLGNLNAEDCRLVYEAIKLAQPGGLGKAESMDVHSDAPTDLLAAMQLAADRDSVAKQYVTSFADIFARIVPWLVAGRSQGLPLTQTVIHTQLQWLSENPDSLIARKCGAEIASRVSQMATAVLRSGAPDDEDFERRLADLDFWLRLDGHRRNPGTTADLIAAGLFVGLREGLLKPPYR